MNERTEEVAIDNVGEDLKAVVEQHRKDGDLIMFVFKQFDESLEKFRSYRPFLTTEELKVFAGNLYKHLDNLVQEHKRNGDFSEWLKTLYTTNKKLGWKYVSAHYASEQLRTMYAGQISEHRNTGDLMDFLWDLICELGLNSKAISEKYWRDNAEKDFPFEDVIHHLLLDDEKKELELIFEILDKAAKNDSHVSSCFTDEFEYILKLFLSDKDSYLYKRYLKIRSKITDAQINKELDEELKKRSSSFGRFLCKMKGESRWNGL